MKKYTATGTYIYPYSNPDTFYYDCDGDGSYTDTCPFDDLNVEINDSTFPLDCGPEVGDVLLTCIELEAYHMWFEPCHDSENEFDRPEGGPADDVVGKWVQGQWTFIFEADGTLTITGPKDCN